MSYPSLLAEIERLRQALENTKERCKRKRIKAKIRRLTEEKERYETVYFGKALG